VGGKQQMAFTGTISSPCSSEVDSVTSIAQRAEQFRLEAQREAEGTTSVQGVGAVDACSVNWGAPAAAARPANATGYSERRRGSALLTVDKVP
jgi:hypothetical protein